MSLIISLIALGLIFYFIEMIPLTDPFSRIIKVIAIILAVVLVLQFFGINLGLPNFNVR